MRVISLINEHFDYMLLLFLRTSGIMISSPVFGRKNVPNMAKIGFCAMLSLVFLSAAREPAVYPSYDSLIRYALVCARELAFGLSMGFVLTAMLDLALTAGGIMAYQIGFSMAGIYDPQTATQASLTGSLLNYMYLLSFFAVNGHLKLIEILNNTIEFIPIGAARVSPAIMSVAAEVASKAFLLAVMVSMPVLASGIMMEVALGIIIRTVPQLNMFVVGIPIKILLGLGVLLLSMTAFYGFSTTIFDNAFSYIGRMFENLRAAG
jgi:flagellar biosynthetic protein FliR